jgi:hypothetical protein
VLPLALVLAACGGSGRLSKSAYEQHLRVAGAHAKQASSGIKRIGVTRQAFAKQLVGARREMQAAAKELEGFEPPRDAEADNETIAATLRYLAAEIAKLQTAARSGNQAVAAAVGAEIAHSKQITAGANAAKDLQRKGYDVGVFGQ